MPSCHPSYWYKSCLTGVHYAAWPFPPCVGRLLSASLRTTHLILIATLGKCPEETWAVRASGPRRVTSWALNRDSGSRARPLHLCCASYSGRTWGSRRWKGSGVAWQKVCFSWHEKRILIIFKIDWVITYLVPSFNSHNDYLWQTLINPILKMKNLSRGRPK